MRLRVGTHVDARYVASNLWYLHLIYAYSPRFLFNKFVNRISADHVLVLICYHLLSHPSGQHMLPLSNSEIYAKMV